MLAPAMEAFGEPSRLLILQCEEQFPWLVWLHCLHMLYVHLKMYIMLVYIYDRDYLF